MNKTEPLVSIVILNWNGLADTLLCLKHVRELDYSNYEVIVVDNGSHDGSLKRLEKIKNIKLVVNSENHGFAGGHVDGLHHTNGEYILILNNDALIQSDYINKALEDFKDPEVAVVGGRAYHLSEDNNKQTTYYSFQVLNPITGEVTTLSHDYGKPSVVNNVSGSCALIRRTIIDELGYFDPKYFAYFEEIDLFARYKRAGYKIVYDPELHVWHKGGASTKNHPYIFYYLMYRNRFRFAVRNFDRPFIRPFLVTYYAHGIKACLRYVRYRDVQDKAEAIATIKSSFLFLPTFISRYTLGKKLPKNYMKKAIDEQVEKISIVIDATDNINKLEASLKSIEKQTLVPSDIVVVSGDNVYNKSHELNVRSVKHNNKSLEAYNLGVVSATNEWVLMLKSGDELDNKEFLSKLMYGAFLHKSSFVAFVEDTQKIIKSDPISLIDNQLKESIRILLTKDAAHNTLGTRIKVDQQTASWIALARTSATRDKVMYFPFSSSIKTIKSPLVNFDQNYINEIKAVLKNQLTLAYRVHAAFLRLTSIPRSRYVQYVFICIGWLFSPKINWRLKIGRLKDLLSGMLTLRRKKVALTLRHIRNEFSWALHPENISLLPENNKEIPVLIICRDLLSTLESIVGWLEKYNLTNIILLDNDSSYPPLMEYYAKTKYQVVPLGRNIGTQSPWISQAIPLLTYETYYILTDPDILPVDECPDDFLDYFFQLHTKYPSYLKVGFALKIDDLPKQYLLREQVATWEKQFWKIELEKDVYDAGIDTTFALYKPNTYTYFINPAIRTAGKYTARHLPWYADSNHPTQEDIYYREHRSMMISSWTADKLPERFIKELERMKEDE